MAWGAATGGALSAGLSIGGKLASGFQQREMAKLRAAYARSAQRSSKTRAATDVTNIFASGAAHAGAVMDQYAQARAVNQLAAFASGVRGHSRFLKASDQRFFESLQFQSLQTRQRATMRELQGIDQYIAAGQQAEMATAQGNLALTQSVFGALESGYNFSKAGAFSK